VILAGVLSLVVPSAAHPATTNNATGSAHSRAAEDALAHAARAWSTNDAPAAIAACQPLIETDAIDATRAGCRMIAAAALVRDAPARAAAVLEPALGALGALRPWGLLLLAEAKHAASETESILPLVSEARGADPRGPLGRRAAAIEALHWLGDPARPGAADALARLLREGHGDAPRLRLALARHLIDRNEADAARPHLLALWRDHPEREEAEHARELLEKLGVAPTWDDLRERVERLLARGDAERALDELGDRNEPTDVLFLRGRAQMDAGARLAAESTLTAYLATSPANAAQVRILLGRLAARRNDLSAAVAHLDAAARGGTGREAAEAAFLAAFLHYDFGAFDQAIERFEAYARAHRHRREEARWFAGWARYLKGDLAGAERTFASGAGGSLDLQVRYWRGRALEGLGRVEEAKAEYRRVMTTAPADWYGLLAAARLGAKPPTLSTRNAGPGKLEGDALRRARLARAEALYRLGFVVAAGEEFDAAVEGKPAPDFLRAAARLAARAGDPHRAFRLSWRLGGLQGAADLAYPRAFPDAVERAAAQSGVDPLLLLAIARQESGFSTTVRSARGAVGLLQLLPATAERLVERLRVDLDPRALEDPHVNLALGSAYLAALLERFGGHPCLAVAAYNAGPQAVVGWQTDPLRQKLAIDAWVEAIPWRETRNYVKAVMSNWAVYRALEKRPPPEIPSALPTPRDGIDF